MRSIKSLLALPFAQRVSSKVRKWAKKPIETQEKVFRNLISSGTKTAFGQDHDFISINIVKARPMHLNLFVMRFPITAISSICHRISGVWIFICLPFLLVMLHLPTYPLE